MPAGDARTQRDAAGHRRRRLAGARHRHRQPRHADQLPRRAAADIREVSVVGAQTGAPRAPARLLAGRRRELRARRRRSTAGERVTVQRRDRRAARGDTRGRLRVPRRHPVSDGGRRRSSPTRRRRPPTTQSFYTLPGVAGAGPDRHRARPRPRGGRHPHDQRARPRPVRAADLHARRAGSSGSSSCRAAKRRRTSTSRPTKAGAMLTWWRGRVLSLGFGQGEDIVMNSRYQTVARVAGGNGLKADLHDFQIAPRRRRLHHRVQPDPLRPARRSRGRRDGAIIDTAIQEIDMQDGPRALGMAQPRPRRRGGVRSRSADGTRRRGTTSTSTRSTPSPTATSASPRAAPGPATSCRRGSGRILWRLGGNDSSFKMGPGTKTAWQHDGRVLPDGEVTFFDDGSNPPIHQQSRGVRIALDLKTHAGAPRVGLHAPRPAAARRQPGQHADAGGRERASSATAACPRSASSRADGSLLFDAHQPFDMSFYRAFRFPWSGRPLSPPAVLASLNNTGEETIVHASWNGATGVAVLARARRRAAPGR